jgi:hypothetical protein
MCLCTVFVILLNIFLYCVVFPLSSTTERSCILRSSCRPSSHLNDFIISTVSATRIRKLTQLVDSIIQSETLEVSLNTRICTLKEYGNDEV